MHQKCRTDPRVSGSQDGLNITSKQRIDRIDFGVIPRNKLEM